MTSKKITVGLYVLLALMGVANLLLVKQNLQMRQSIEATRPQRPAVGDKVPPFTAAGLDGAPIDVAYSSQGRERLILFYTPSCPYSRQQFPAWLDLVKRADKSRLEVLALAADSEDKVKLRDYLREVGAAHPEGINFPTALISGEVRRKYKLSETPLTLLVAGDGTVKEVWAGRWDGQVIASVNGAMGLTED